MADDEVLKRKCPVDQIRISTERLWKCADQEDKRSLSLDFLSRIRLEVSTTQTTSDQDHTYCTVLTGHRLSKGGALRFKSKSF